MERSSQFSVADVLAGVSHGEMGDVVNEVLTDEICEFCIEKAMREQQWCRV